MTSRIGISGIISALLLLSQAAFADPAIYRDGLLYLPEGAVVNADGSVDYYSEIYFSANANGTLSGVSAEVREQTGTSLEGESGYYQNDQLVIPAGAAIVADGNAAYFGDIVLTPNADGTFAVTAGEERTLVEITDVSTQNFTGFPNFVTINVSGTKSSSCVELEQAAYNRQEDLDGRVFTVVVAEAELEEGVSCDPEPTPFTITVDLDVCTCSPGDYTTIVNGSQQTFFTLTL